MDDATDIAMSRIDAKRETATAAPLIELAEKLAERPIRYGGWDIAVRGGLFFFSDRL
ncbi:hypothetical protein [Mesorhizobium koreense]|uniref:hypothetical protein n=1 Tax=Mesorhizobium koreense TaxID=3074855 RepID=UPI00287BB13A|nr:hypothetical protein [Mesorhizobium sp. WR6]